MTVGEHAGLQEFVDVVECHRASSVAVVDEFGRLLGAVDREDYPDVFGCEGARVCGTPPQRLARTSLSAGPHGTHQHRHRRLAGRTGATEQDQAERADAAQVMGERAGRRN
jgi:hypothetical protein